MRKLKIAQIAPLWFSIPPEKYGGVELVISLITEELVRRGHEVYLFASKESKSKANLQGFYSSLGKVWDAFSTIALLHTKISFQKAVELKVDIIHAHLGADQFSLFFENLSDFPVVYTAHNEVPREIASYFSESKIISISEAHKENLMGFKNFYTVYNGIDIKKFEFSEQPTGGYLAFLGLIRKNKNPLGAINIAKKSHQKLKMAGPISDVKYFKEVEKHLSTRINYQGEIDQKQKSLFLGRAKALLAPITWDEPFGLYLVEAMACGTPVIAYRRGDVAEIVKDGITGFVCPPDDEQCMIKAIKNIDKIDRRACRRHVEENFTVEKMVDGYEKVYLSVLNNQ